MARRAAAGLAQHEVGPGRQRVAVLERHVGVADRDAELLLDEVDDLDDARGVDDARRHQRRVVAEPLLAAAAEPLGDERAQFLDDLRPTRRRRWRHPPHHAKHPFVSATGISRRSAMEPRRSRRHDPRVERTPPSRGARLARLAARLAVPCALAPLLATAGSAHWTLDLLSHFPHQCLLLLLLALCVQLPARRWKTAALLLPSIALTVVRLWPLWFGGGPV